MTTIKSRTNTLDMALIKEIALALHLEENCTEIEQSSYDSNVFEVGGGKYPNEYLVLTDEEADERALEYAIHAVEEYYLHEIPESSPLRHWVDVKGFAEHAVNVDGRGHILSSYDGYEYEVYVKDQDIWLYIYRTN